MVTKLFEKWSQKIFLLAGKRVRRSLDDLDSPDLFSTADALHDLSKVAKLRLLEVSQTPGLSIDEISAYLIGNIA